MTPPTTYAQWLTCLQTVQTGTADEETLILMEQGSIEWTPGVAERLVQRLYATIEGRLKLASNYFQLGLNRSGGDETLLIGSILTLRKRLSFLMRLAKLQAFPDEVNNAMEKLLKEFAETTQESLLDSAKTDRTGRLRITIKNNPITNFDKVEDVLHSSSKKVIQTPLEIRTEPIGTSSTKKRRVIWK